MSSTNRSNARDSHIADYYKTPVSVIEEFLAALDNEIAIDMDVCTLDPCAGGSQTDDMSYPTAIHNYYCVPLNHIHTIDIRKDSKADIKTDYLTYQLDYKPHVIISNPPFNLAMEIIEKALADVEDGGYVIMLLRLNFLGSAKRFEFFKNNLPEYIFVHHKRISFTDKGTDSIEYGHFVWRKGYHPKFSKIRVI